MESRVDHKKLQEKWQVLRKDCFKSVPDERKPFTILNPPPNITGILHIGHLFNGTINDVLARRKRQEGFNVCFRGGLDHAGLATQIKVEQHLKQQGITKEMLGMSLVQPSASGREKFLEECDKWRSQCSGTIVNQLQKVGLSMDFDNLTFTLDPNYYANVIDTFVKLYKGGLIYKGNYMTNWCTALETAISDEECVDVEEDIGLYYINYKLDTSDDLYLTVATTRPETIFGDVAVAYNPEDERYKKYKGMNVIIPIINRSVPLVEDERIKIEFGTGLCKITPAHDKNDFVTGQKYNLPVIPILDKSGHIANTGTKYDGMYGAKARKEIIKELTDLKFLIDTQIKKSIVSRCARSGSVIEPMLTTQWFMRMRPLADMATNLLETGQVEFYPERIKNVFNAWTANIRDWCISRQIVYSHQIPVWYCTNGHELCENIKQESCHCGCTNLVQESDCLDTWASSWIWQFGTFTKEEMDYYYPIDVIVSGQDILFFWIMRMMMSSAFLHNKPPFRRVLFHGIVRDDKNIKMSKSAGNGIDPLDIINTVGLDPARFAMIMIAPKDGDLKVSLKSFDVGKTFCTKFWNVARFLQSNGVFVVDKNVDIIDELSKEDDDILNALTTLKANVIDCYDKMDLQRLSTYLYTFTWDTFANNYLEYSKDKLSEQRKRLLLNIFTDLIKLLYPIIPHVTEELWEIMGNSDLYKCSL